MLNLYKYVRDSVFGDGYILGAPKESLFDSYEKELIRRFGGQFKSDGTVQSDSAATKGAYESAFSYMDKVVDRQISKASGLLTFNSILLAVVLGPDKLFTCHTNWRLALTTMLLLSCTLLLDMMVIVWSKADVFGSAAKEFKGSLRVCCGRTRYLSLSTFLALGAILLMLFMAYRYGLQAWS